MECVESIAVAERLRSVSSGAYNYAETALCTLGGRHAGRP
jgi:hypothetical protein